MKRRVEFDTYVRENRERYLDVWLRDASRPRPRVRAKPRASEEVALLDRLTQERWNRALELGKLDKIGSRRYRLNG